MLTLLLLATSQQPAPVPHAHLYAPGVAGFVVAADLDAIATAYEQAPIFEFARDEAIVGIVEQVTGSPLDTALISPSQILRLLLEQLPPEAEALGVEELVHDVVGLSYALNLTADFEPALVEVFRYVFTGTELFHIEQRLRDHMQASGGRAPADLTALLDGDSPSSVDAWGRPYEYEMIEDLGPRIVSLGADGRPGGDGFAADLELTLLGVEQPSPATLAPLLDSVGVQFSIEFGSEAAAQQLVRTVRQSLDDAPPELKATEFVHGEGLSALEGIEFTVDVESLQLDGWMARRGSYVIFGALGEQHADLAARLDGRSASLATSDALRSSLDALPARAGAQLGLAFGARSSWFYLDQVLDAAITAGLRESVERETDEQVPAGLWDFVESFEPDGRPLLVRQVLAGSQFVTDRLRPGGAPATRLFPGGAVERDRLAVLGDSAGLVYATQVDLVAAYDALLRAAASMLERDPEAYHQQGVELLGFDLRADLLAHVEPSIVVSLDPIRGIGTPRAMAYFALSDADAVARSVNTLVESIAAIAPNDFSASTRPYRGMPLARLGLRGLDLGMATLEPSFGVVGDQLIIGLSGSQVKKELRRLAGDAEDEPATLHALADETRTPLDADVTTVVYLDWAAFVGGAYDSARAVAGMMGGSDLADLPVDFATLPPGSLLTDYFAPTLWITRRAPAGEHTTVTSSIGPEAQLLLQGIGFGAVAAEQSFGPSETIVIEAVPLDPVSTPDLVTDQALSRVRVALQIYYYESGNAYPNTLASLAEPTTNFPRGCLDGEPLPVDGWGQPLRYLAAGGAKGYRLWSVGPDGVDAAGAGDDILVEVE